MKSKSTELKLKYKTFHDLATLERANEDDAGLDLRAFSIEELRYIPDQPDTVFGYRLGLGIGVQIPKGYKGDLLPRSSIYKYGTILSNSVGLIDAGYIGELGAVVYPTNIHIFNKEVVQPILNALAKEDAVTTDFPKMFQLVITKFEPVTLEKVDELESTTRGTKGFGSSGN